jgi:hypothetical protein
MKPCKTCDIIPWIKENPLYDDFSDNRWEIKCCDTIVQCECARAAFEKWNELNKK